MAIVGSALRLLLAAGLLGGTLFVALGAIETAPRVAALPPPTGPDARAAQEFLRQVEGLRGAPDGRGELSASVEEANGLFRLLARAHPDLAGRARIEGEALVLEVSVPVPRSGGALWLNAVATVLPFEDGARLTALRLGHLPLPSQASTAVLLRALDWRLGDGTGSRLLAAVPRMRLADDRIVLGVDLGSLPRGNLARLTVGNVYGRPMPDHAEVAAFVAGLQADAAAGRLPTTGSALPWLRAVLDHAATQADAEDPERVLIAGFIALNYLCGSSHFVTMFTPRREGEEAALPPPGMACSELTLRDRIDTRRHFITAATLKVLSERQPAVAAGEAKELYDMMGGSFDFTDIAANNSGIRLATLILATPPERWSALAAALNAEDEVIVALDGIPGEMPREDFVARFGGLDSRAYGAVVAEIEARIDALPVHAGGHGG